MKTAIIAAVILLMAFGFAFAQQDPDDPGIQDSIIISTVYVDSGASEVWVPVNFFADDSVQFYNVPISWDGQGIYPDSIANADSTGCWTGLDTIMTYLRIFSFYDIHDDPDCVPLFPSVDRVLLFTIRFRIEPDAPAQQVTLDTTWDDRIRSVLFGLSDGLTEITPAVVPGYIVYDSGIQRTDEDDLPKAFSLSQNYPNPFNPSTNIGFSLNKPAETALIIYDLLGRRIRALINGNLETGDYLVMWNGKNDAGADVPSGTYFYRLSSGDKTDCRRMTLIR